MKMTQKILTTCVVAVFITGIQLPANQQITQQSALSLWQAATSVDNEYRKKSMVLAGNTACNPRAQVCED